MKVENICKRGSEPRQAVGECAVKIKDDKVVAQGQ